MKTLLALLLAVSTPGAAEQADVVVVGATPAGVAAAVAAARGGARVVLVEESHHVGGITAGGLTNTDIRKHGAVGGIYNEFKRRVAEHYTGTYGPDSKEVALCRGGNMFQPKVAEMIFRKLLADEATIRLMEGARVTAAHTPDGNARPGTRRDGPEPKDFPPVQRLTAITIESAAGPATLAADVFIDATYEGDLSALAGADYRVGRESTTDFKEKHAGKIYVRFGDTNPLPGSTGEADAGIQAFCFRAHLTKDPANRLPVEKPADFNRDDYRHLLADFRTGRLARLDQVIQFFPMPGGNFETNSSHPHETTGVPSESLDLAEENYGWPEAGPAERARIFRRYWNYDEGLLWLVQHDADVPEAIRKEALEWGYPKDEFTDNRGRPHHIYVRQGRRIWGEFTLTENAATPVFATGLPARQPDGIAVAEYPFDSHAVTKYDPAHPLLRPGYFYVEHEPIQLPYRMLVPRSVDGLLVPVACSTTHVGYQTLRMEPVFMALGEASGIAAAMAAKTKTPVRGIEVSALQREILRRGGVILYEGTAKTPDDDGAPAAHGLSVRDGGLWLRGRRYRGIGVNQADLFQRVIHEAQPQEAASLADLRFLGRKKIPFVRFWCCGFWPVDWKRYLENREEWFSRLDRVVRTAEEADVGLVACLFWRPETVSDLCGEFTSSWGDPESRTRQFMATYTREVVERYRDSPAIWGWEFANEWNLACDLPNGMESLGKVTPHLGVNRAKDPRNLVTTEIAAAAMQAFATEVRRHDLHRCISSGNAQPRASAWHQASEGSWAGDEAAQVRDMFRRHNPAPIDLASIHIYPATAPLRLGGIVGTRPVLELLQAAASTAGQPLFVGEFSAGGGHTGPADISMEEFRREQTEILAAIVESEVDLAAHWVYAYGHDRTGPGLVRPGNEYEWVLDQIVEHNARLTAAASGGGRPDDASSPP